MCPGISTDCSTVMSSQQYSMADDLKRSPKSAWHLWCVNQDDCISYFFAATFCKSCLTVHLSVYIQELGKSKDLYYLIFASSSRLSLSGICVYRHIKLNVCWFHLPRFYLTWYQLPRSHWSKSCRSRFKISMIESHQNVMERKWKSHWDSKFCWSR